MWSASVLAPIRLRSLLVAVCLVGVVHAPVASATSSVFSLSLTSSGTAASSLATDAVVLAQTNAPIELAGQTTQTIEQMWDSSELRLRTGAITAPEGWPLEYTVDGISWSSTVPNTLSSVRGIRATGAVNSLGFSSALQANVSRSDGAVRVPTVSSISVTGLGDGWDVFFDEAYTKVFNVFHHSSPAKVDCHSLFDGSRCTGYPISMPSGLGTNDRSTGISAGDKVWIAVGSGSNPGGGFACFNVSGGACTAPFVKLTSNTLTGVYNNVVNMTRSGQYLFAQNRKDGKLLCLDSSTEAGCANMPAGGFDLGHGPSENYKSTLLTVGSRVYSHDGTGEVGCLDTNTWALCTDWTTTWTSDRNFQLMALPNASGTIVAICTFNDSGATCVNSAKQPYTTPPSFNTTLALTPAYIPGYGKTPETAGTRVYWSDANYINATGKISCWDASLSAGAGGTCANFPLNDENYTVVVDPQNSDCIWTNDNNGSIEAFNALTGAAGCPVDSDPVVLLPYTTTVPRLACAEIGRVRSWTKFKAIMPNGVVASDLRVTVKRDGVKVTGWDNLTPDVSGEIDLTTLTVGQTSTRPVFEVKVVGKTSQVADTLLADITYLSDPPQLCVDLLVLKECPTGSGIAPSGSLPVDPTVVDSTVTNSGASTVVTPLVATASRAPVSNCQGSMSGTVLRTPPSGSFPISGASVTLRDGSGNEIDVATTDASGRYSFPSLYAGAYTVSYSSTTENVNVVTAANSVQDFSVPVGNPTARDIEARTAQNVPVTVEIDATADPLTSIDSSTLVLRQGTGQWGSSVAVSGEGTWDVVAGKIRFTPVKSFSGRASTIEYRVSDLYANLATADAVVTVTESAIVALADTASGTQGVTLYLDAEASAGALSIDYATVELATEESGPYSKEVTITGVGTYSANSKGRVTFVPAGEFTGSHKIFYRLRDELLRSTSSTMAVTVLPSALTGSSDTVQPAVNGVLPVKGIPNGAIMSVPTVVKNVKSLSFSNGSVLIEPVRGFSGIIRVPVAAAVGTASLTTEVVLTVLPYAPAIVKVANSTKGALITWSESATTNATGYIVRVNGLVVCRTTEVARTCRHNGLIGPRSIVEVQTLGADATISPFTAGNPVSRRCQKVGSVHFATDSALLTESAKRALRSIAADMRTQRFNGFCVSGHTDARSTFASNDALSYYRANAVKNYLTQFLPKSMRSFAAYSGEYRPIQSNQTKSGMASNRRVEISVG